MIGKGLIPFDDFPRTSPFLSAHIIGVLRGDYLETYPE